MRFFCLWAVLLCSVVSTARSADTPRSQPMNIVFILIDDLGWADLQCYGSTFHETPHLDALAASAARFTQAYAACPVCSPTRASILTGRHPVRVNITDWIPGHTGPSGPSHRFLPIADRNELALAEVTIAEILCQANYQTFFAGKWHLGGQGFLPTDQGFETNLGGGHYGQPPGGYFAPWKNEFLKDEPDGTYLTEHLTQESIAFLKQRDASRPFFLFLSHYDVHTPLHRAEKYADHFDRKARDLRSENEPVPERSGVSRSRQGDARYASMVSAVDQSVGQLMETLRELQLEESTAVIFTSDNGGLCTQAKPGPTSNLPLRAGKGWLYEGGIRVPLLMKVPNVTQPGEVIAEPVLSTDYFPTILELAGQSPRPDLALDGESLCGLFSETHEVSTRPLAWHYPHYHGSLWTPGAAWREGDWKLIEFYEFDDAELYNLRADPGEHSNLASEEPRKLTELRRKLRAWQETMQATMPEPNPNWIP